ncbi:phage holin [Rummeliibacillus sp. TYF-LIM-RU47]|uniref:phage holin n=1 Tax=Rummeliibacillus sp. TYF-LIM-RU47 TaxID=2608406 RepID=UPI00123BF5EA|nr:phage holin [Rummeliibacillus sp. TYF-LIM-RU47]
MTKDKLKQYVALFGGVLSAILLLFQSLRVKLDWFNQESIDNFTNVLLAIVPFAVVLYGVWKNTYVVSNKAKEQEKVLKDNGLK